jgi:protease IV
MPQFLKYLFASCLGTALALGLLLFVGFSSLAGLVSSAAEDKAVTVRENSVLELNFDNVIPEKTNNTEMDPFDVDQANVVGVTDMIKMIKLAKDDGNIKGIYIRPQMVSAGKVSTADIRAALEDFKTSGKFIVAYGDFYTQNAYYMASVADSIYLNPVGAVEFKGYAATITFFKEMLDKLDVQMRIFYAGQFKSATEPYRLDKMSDQNRLQTRVYLNALYDIFINDISRTRGISPNDLRGIADRYEGFSAEMAQKNRLVDHIGHEDVAINAIKKRIGLNEKEKLNRVKMDDYYVAKGKGVDLTDAKDKIAVVYMEGTITDGVSAEPNSITDGQYVKILRKIRNDDRIKAVVIRMDSPGGSVLASENIFREVLLCKQAGKPVVVSMANVAASGGYYIGCQADSIFAEPGTITGSIGVFGIVPILQKTMKNNLGITVDTVKTGKFSAFGTPLLDFSDEESKIVQARIEATYEDFLSKVAKGRRKTRDEIHEVAQGRVWPGVKAKEIGLVDDIGGLDRALAAAARLASIEKYKTKEYPETKTGLEQFVDKYTNKKDRDDAISNSVLKAELGDMYPVYRSFRDIRNAKGIQARLPYEMVIW